MGRANAITQWLQRNGDARWSAYILVERICEYSSDPTTPFAFAGLCCLDDDDTAESVQSPIVEDMNELTLWPTNQTEVVPISGAPVPVAPFIQPRKQVQISPHQLQSSSSSSADLRHVSQASNTSDLLGYVPLPGTLLLGTKGHGKDAVNIRGQLHLLTPF